MLFEMFTFFVSNFGKRGGREQGSKKIGLVLDYINKIIDISA
jgi:hypothetical protein